MVVELEIEDGWICDWGLLVRKLNYCDYSFSFENFYLVVMINCNDLFLVQCVVKDDFVIGKWIVVGVYWDYDCYGGFFKCKLGLFIMMFSWDKDYVVG